MMKSAMSDTDRIWERWGKIDPYYGVLAHDRFSTANIESSRGEFFATGEDFIAKLLARFEQCFGAIGTGRALDHGCGVGRLTLPLARRFGEVVAIDVSPSMLSEAEANTRQAGLTNIHYAMADDRLSNAAGEFDFVNSYIVLQHVPVRRGMTILFALVEKVRPGGAFQIHLSVRTDGWRPRALWWSSIHVPGVKIIQNVMAGRTWNSPAMQMNDYPLGVVLTELARRGITDLLVTAERHDKFVTCCLLGRTPAA